MRADQISAEQSDPVPLRVPPEVIYRSLGASSVLVSLTSNRVFELNETGARIWELVTAHVPLPDVVATLVTEFTIDEASARLQTEQLIAELVDQGLLQS